MTPTKLIQQANRLHNRFLSSDRQAISAKVDRSMLQFNQLDQLIWPHPHLEPQQESDPSPQGLTKKHLLAYYAAISPHLLAQLQDRPLILQQLSGDIRQASHSISYTQEELPTFVATIEMYSEWAEQNVDYLLCQNTASLLWLINSGVLEIGHWLSRINNRQTNLPAIFINSSGNLDMSVINYPDCAIFELGAATALRSESAIGQDEQFKYNRDAMLHLRQYLAKLGLQCYVQANDSRQMHVIIPIQRHYTFEDVRHWVKRVSQQLINLHPHLFSSGWQLNHSPRVAINFQQNARGKALPAPLTPLANPEATIVQPIDWKQIETVDTLQPFSLFDYFNQPSETRSKQLDQLIQTYTKNQLQPQELPAL